MNDSIDSPNLHSLDRWTFDVRRVEKPWGHELIWALTDVYCGKVLFVKAGCSLSLQFHREKDESWLVQSGRAKLELGDVGQAVLNVDLVDLCLPTDLHKSATLTALAAGKHVLVEKPIALSVADADEMIAAAQKAGKLLMVAQVLRYFPEFAYVKPMYRSTSSRTH